MMNRRTFIGGAALVVTAPPPASQALPSPPPDAGATRISFIIEGWSTPATDDTAGQVAIRINAGWRASWR